MGRGKVKQRKDTDGRRAALSPAHPSCSRHVPCDKVAPPPLLLLVSSQSSVWPTAADCFTW